MLEFDLNLRDITNLNEKIDYTIISFEKKELLYSKLHKNLKDY